MFDAISCFISGNKIEVHGKTFLLGELSADILGITPDEYKKMREASERIETLLEQDDSGETLFALRVETGLLRSLLIKRKLFQTLALPETDDEDDYPELFEIPEELREPPPDEASEIMEQMSIGYLEENLIRRHAEKYCEIVDDIYSFNQTMFWFIDKYLSHLKKLNTENYAATLYDFFHNPQREKMIVNPIRNDGQVFMRFDPVQVQYIPREIPGSPDNYVIYEYYHIEQLQSFLKVDFYRALMAGHVIRRCKNCKQFFLLTNGLHTEYCDRPIPGKPHRNCRNQGAKNAAKEKARNNPVIKSYTQAYNRIHSDYVRGRISLDERDMARRKIIDLRDEAISGKYRDAEVDTLMRTEQLYGALGITRK